MKIHVVSGSEGHIEGYERVEVSENGDANLSGYSDNECSFILATDALDSMGYDQAKIFIMTARQKLRLGGTVIVGGTDMRLFARSIVADQVNVEEANQVLFTKKSMLDTNTVSSIVKDMGLKVITTRIAGIHYEVEAKRETPSN